MNEIVNYTISKFNMLADGDTIIIGLSGGADSVSLTHFLSQYKKDRNINLLALHVNHGIRGDEAYRDENFVRDFCERIGIELYVKRVNVIELAKQRGIGLEECGRNVRYEYFSEIANKIGGKIATAHTLSDSQETVLLNMTRGCGLRGLCGIPPVRDNVIRPLILASRDDVEKYCESNNLGYVIDSTNLTQDYTRNKIRISVIPVLKEINETFDVTFRRMVEQNIDEENYLREVSEEAFNKARLPDGFDVSYLRSLDTTIKNRVVKKIIEWYCQGDVESKHVKAVCGIVDVSSGAVTLPSNVNVYVHDNKLKKKTFKEVSGDWEREFLGTDVLTLYETTFIIEMLPINRYNDMVKKQGIKKFVCLDSDTIPSDSLFRNRRQGDKFCQLGRGVTKKVKSLFNEKKIPPEQRDKIVILASGSRVLWIDGIGISQDCKISDNTKFVTIIRREFDND